MSARKGQIGSFTGSSCWASQDTAKTYVIVNSLDYISTDNAPIERAHEIQPLDPEPILRAASIVLVAVQLTSRCMRKGFGYRISIILDKFDQRSFALLVGIGGPTCGPHKHCPQAIVAAKHLCFEPPPLDKTGRVTSGHSCRQRTEGVVYAPRYGSTPLV
jgi:hypothetical protein